MASSPHFVLGLDIEVTSSEEGYIGSWFPASITKLYPRTKKATIEYHHFTENKRSKKKLVEDVLVKNLRPMPPPVEMPVEEFGVGDKVEVFYEKGWWEGKVKSVLGGERYSVFFWYTEQELEYGVEEMRVHQKWVDGVWRVPEKQEKKTDGIPQDQDVRSPGNISGCIVATLQDRNSPMELPSTRGSVNVLLNIPCGQTKISSKVDIKRKRMRGQLVDVIGRKKRPAKATVSTRNASVGGNPSCNSLEEYSIENKLSVVLEIQRLWSLTNCSFHPQNRAVKADEQNVAVQKSFLSDARTTTFSLVDAEDVAICEKSGFPFIKNSPLWSLVESMEEFPLLPSLPHFSPLKQYKEEIREGLAIGCTSSFLKLLEETREASIKNESIDFFHSRLEALLDLEPFGFNVDPIRARLLGFLEIEMKHQKEVDKAVAIEMMNEGKKEKLEARMNEMKKKHELLLQKRENALANMAEGNNEEKKMKPQEVDKPAAIEKMNEENKGKLRGADE